jgi:hypothetical protein
MSYLRPLIGFGDVPPWGWGVLAAIVAVGAFCGHRWPRLVRPTLVSLIAGGILAYLAALRILAIDPNRDLSYVPLWRPFAWMALALALFLPYVGIWSFGVGGAGVVSRRTNQSRLWPLLLVFASMAVFQVAVWCADVVLD